MAIKQALDNIDAVKLKKDDIMRESVENLANINMIDDLMEVHQGKKSQEQVFTQAKERFADYWKRSADQDELVKSSNQVIMENYPAF